MKTRPSVVTLSASAACTLLSAQSHAQTNSFANTIISYVSGSNPAPGYTNANVALGEPTRYTGEAGGFPGAVTPFNAPWENDEIVSIGEGGELTVMFDHPVTNDPNNPFGIDLLIFGNAWYADTSWPNGIAGSLANEGGDVSVSADGIIWTSITGVSADGTVPTLGYADLTDPYALNRGSLLTDFTLPVDPLFDGVGKTFAQISAAYNRSGGGTGVDIGAFGLSEISYIRVTNPLGSGTTPEIDAFSDVSAIPAPGAFALLMAATGFAGLSVRRRK